MKKLIALMKRWPRKNKVLPMSRTILIKQGEAEDKA